MNTSFKTISLHQQEAKMINPIAHIKSAWQGTSSIWGKIAVALFYSFLWMQILWGVVLVFSPRSGFECAWDNVADVTAAIMDCLMIGMNLFSFGYFGFAHVHGIKIWNIVIFFLLGLSAMLNNIIFIIKLTGNEDECAVSVRQSVTGQTALMSAWAVLTLACTLLDDKMRGENPENTPLYP